MWGYHLLLVGPNGVDSLGELLGLLEIRQLTLHPDGIRIWCICHGAVDRTIATTLQPVEALPRPRALPVEVDINTSQTLCDRAGLHIALALNGGKELSGDVLLVDVHASLDRVEHGVVERLEVGLGEPVVLDGLEVWAGFSGLLGGVEESGEGLEGRVGGTKDVGVVAGIDGAGDKGGGFGVCAGNGEEVRACVALVACYPSCDHVTKRQSFDSKHDQKDENDTYP